MWRLQSNCRPRSSKSWHPPTSITVMMTTMMRQQRLCFMSAPYVNVDRKDYTELLTSRYDTSSSTLMSLISNAPSTLPDLSALVDACQTTVYVRDAKPNKKVIIPVAVVVHLLGTLCQ